MKKLRRTRSGQSTASSRSARNGKASAGTRATAAATRIERDTMGELRVPAQAYYGVQTARAIENFPVSGLRFPRAFIRALGLIKSGAAIVNHSLGLLDKARADAIKRAG